MALDRVQFIADQLRALTPGADWKAGGVDRATELARIFDRNGVLDLGKLRIVPVTETHELGGYYLETEGGNEWVPPQTVVTNSFAFTYDGRRIGFMGTPDRADSTAAFEVHPRGFVAAWSAEGHGHVGYVVRPNKARTGIEIAPVWDSSSDAAGIRSALLQLASFAIFIALPLAGVSVGASLGSAIFGPTFATAYPLVSTAVGNAALATVFNGGDVAAAAKAAALGAVSGGVGGLTGAHVTALTESPLFGQLAQAATSAAISGGDLKTAVASTLLRNGVTMLSNDPNVVPGIADLVFDSGGEWGGGGVISTPEGPIYYADEGAPYDPGLWDVPPPLPPVWDVPQIDTGGGVIEVPNQWSGGGWEWEALPPLQPIGESWIGDPDVIPNVPAMPAAQPGAPGVPLRADSPAFNPQQMIGTVTSAAMAALQLVQAFRSLNNPAIQTTARYVQPSGAVSVVGSNGLVQTRSPTGQITYTRPPVGVPQSTVDGRLVVNNGDGTYTSISASGQSTVQTYATSSAGGGFSLGNIPPALLIGGAVLVFMAMKRR